VVDEGPLFREADESRAYSDSGRSRMRTRQRMRTCIEDGCDRPHKARGRCHVHYERWRDQRPDGPRCQAPDCDRPAVAFGWCMRDYQRMRINGTLERKHRWFDRQAQQAILANLRAGMTLSAAATAAGWDDRSVRAMVSNGRRGIHPNLVEFARQVDAILVARAKPKRNGNGLSPQGAAFLAQLDLETERDLYRRPGRQPWPQEASSSYHSRTG
jgi:hypothetical protein